MKTYKLFTEGFKKWSDVKNPNVKKEAGKLLKALDAGEVLAYSAEHDEFSVFKNEKELKAAQKGSKGKDMKWLKVENNSLVDFNLIRKLVKAGVIEKIPTPMSEAFKFKGAVKHGFLEKSDKKYVDTLEKKGWEIEEFNLTSKGYEITIKKGSKEIDFIDKKSPSNALRDAAKKAK